MRLLAALIGGTALWVMTAAAATPQSPPAKPPAGTGLIAGKVVESGSNQVVPETIVTLSGPSDLERRVMVDAQGRFVFAGLAAGRYQVQAEQFGYMRGEYGRLRPAGGALRIDLADGQRFTDADILMWRLVSITGRVVDENGEPVVGVAVRPLGRSVNKGQVVLTSSFAGYRSLTTDDRGVYRATMLPPGDYAIAVPARVSTFPVEVMRNIIGSGVSLGITQTAPLGDSKNLNIGDHVLTSVGSVPIPPARDGGPLAVYQTTFYPGATSVDGATVLSLGPGENRTGVDIRLVAAPTMRVSGRILGPDGPLALTAFRLWRADGAKTSDEYDFEVATGISDAEGRFTLLGVPRGTYVLRVRTTRPRPGNTGGPAIPVFSADQPVTVGETDVTDVEVMARRVAAIAGRVEIRGNTPVRPSDLTLIVESFSAALPVGLNPTIDKDGRFRVEVPPARYLVWAIGPDDVRCVSTSQGKIVSDDLLNVGAEDIDDIVIVCGGPFTRLSGIVRDENGQPDPRARVLAFPAERKYWSGEFFTPRRKASVRVTTAATYAISELPPGDYFLVAIPEVSTIEWETAAARDVLIRSATPITLGPGAVRAVDLRTAAIK